MTDNTKKICYAVIIFVVLIAGYYFFYYNEGGKKRGVERETITKSDVLAEKLARQYHAISGWEKDIAYTIQIQDRLLSKGPALFKGYVSDIYKQDRKIFVRFNSSYAFSLNLRYSLELECDKKIVDKILSRQKMDEWGDGFFDEFAVVANINEVSKPTFAIKGYSSSTEDVEEVEIDIEPSELFVAHGNCVDIAYIRD